MASGNILHLVSESPSQDPRVEILIKVGVSLLQKKSYHIQVAFLAKYVVCVL